MRTILMGLLILITFSILPFFAKAQGLLDAPWCQKEVNQYKANPNMEIPRGMTLMCIKAYQNMHPQQTALAKSGGLPTSAPNYYENWLLIRPSDVSNNIVYVNQLPPLVPYLQGQGLTDAQITQWAPFILQNYCQKDVAQEPSCFQYASDNGSTSDQVEMTEGDVQTLLQWMKSGYPLDTIMRYTSDFGPNLVLGKLLIPAIHNDCPNHTYSEEDFTKLNPYQAVGKCVVISAKVVQVLTAHTSLVDATPGAIQLTGAVLDYGRGYSPNVGNRTVVLANCYKISHWNAMGGRQTAPLCKVVFDIGKWQSAQQQNTTQNVKNKGGFVTVH